MPPFQAARELIRRVQTDCAVEIDGNAYSVPWRLIGETVRARGLLQIGKHQGVSSSCRPGANSGCRLTVRDASRSTMSSSSCL
jgi:hypothetical protein